MVNCSDCIYDPMCGLASKMSKHTNISCSDFKAKADKVAEIKQIVEVGGESVVSSMIKPDSIRFKTKCNQCGYRFEYRESDIDKDDGKIECPLCASRCYHMPTTAFLVEVKDNEVG